MESNKVLKELHEALVKKAKDKCKADGNKKMMLEVGNEIIAYGMAWTEAYSDDGIMDDEEEKNINSVFCDIIDRRVPNVEHKGIDWAWNGLSVCFIKVWDGLKYYLNKWFDLGLK